MKRNILKIAVPVLCAAVLFTGCGVARSVSGETAQDLSVNAPTAEQTAYRIGEIAEATVTEAAETVSPTSGADETTDLFSARDLSAEYDDETIAVLLTGSGAAADPDKVSVTGSTVTIAGSGTYLISGTLDDGSIVVDAGKEDKVQLVLNGVSVRSDSYAAVYVKQADKVFVTLGDGTQNTLSNGGGFTQRDENNVDAVVFAKDDITFNGTGSLTIASPEGHGIVGKDEVTIAGGVYTITSGKCAIRANDSIAIADGSFTLTAGTDGLHAENDEDDTQGNIHIVGGTFTIKAYDDAIHANALLQIDGGSFGIAGAEGLEATYIQINDGDISIGASDDGVNAARKSSAYTPAVEIAGGTLTIVMSAGDTDGVDSNGDLIISGGTVNVTGQSAFDYDGTGQYTGGVLIVNGQQLSALPNRMMGGGGMQGGMPGGGRGRIG